MSGNSEVTGLLNDLASDLVFKLRAGYLPVLRRVAKWFDVRRVDLVLVRSRPIDPYYDDFLIRGLTRISHGLAELSLLVKSM